MRGEKSWWIGAAGGVGGFTAVLTDLIQKEQASAILEISERVSKVVVIPPWVVLILIPVLSVLLCYIFEVETRTRAFYTGASILSLLMTSVPYEIPAPLAEGGLSGVGGVVYAADSGSRAIQGEIRITQAGGGEIKEVMVVTVWKGKEKMGQERTKTGRLRFGLPPGTYRIEAQAKGFGTVEREFKVGGDSWKLVLEMKPSKVPDFIQRVIKLR